jgi:hypothetical protein
MLALIGAKPPELVTVTSSGGLVVWRSTSPKASAPGVTLSTGARTSGPLAGGASSFGGGGAAESWGGGTEASIIGGLLPPPQPAITSMPASPKPVAWSNRFEPK